MAGHGATSVTAHPAQVKLSGSSHVGATRRGGPPVVTGSASFFRMPAVSNGQVGFIRQNQPIPAPVFGQRNVRLTGPIFRYLGGPRFPGEF